MKRIYGIFYVLALVFVLAAAMLPQADAKAAVQAQYDYVSIGDSLAAGTSYDNLPKDGFSDYTAEHFERKGMLKDYTKLYAIPGYKTAEVLRDLKLRPVLRKEIQEANLISISAGANDILSAASIDYGSGKVTIDQGKAKEAIVSITANYQSIFDEIEGLNGNAEIYVMGYYFPFPHLSADQKPALAAMAKLLNSTIKDIAEENGAVFVDVYDRFGDDAKRFLPKPTNIHPNADGYKAMSEEFVRTINMTKTADAEGHWAEKELLQMVRKGYLEPDAEGKIYPEKEITRAEVASILYALLPRKLDDIVPDPGFKDVPAAHPSYEAIAYLTSRGVFSKGDKFHPDDALERIQLAKVISIALNLKAKDNPVVFKDTNKHYWGYPYIQAVATNRLMQGNKSQRFDLYNKVTRGQFAAVTVRASKLQ